MAGLFWVLVAVMAAVALGFIAMPLLKENRKPLLLVVCVSLPVVAFGIYMKLGSPGSGTAGEPPHLPSNTASNAPNNTKIASVASMVDGLAARLQDDPNDGGSWLLLARSYRHLGRLDEAVDAYAKAAALGQVDAELAALNSGENVTGTSAAQISGNVSLAPEARSFVNPTDTVFIFARAVNGSPMPVAVLKRPAAELPIDFSLNDSQAMTADMKLSDVEEVIVTARITRSGDATATLQGLEAKSEVVRVAENQHLTLIIEQDEYSK